MKNSLIAFVVGLIFALGLGISGMTDPKKVQGFLDFFGNWDITLLYVLAGAVGVHFVSYRLIRKKSTPLFDSKWHFSNSGKITPRLILGSIIFGAGWGLAGFCPGPALTSLASGKNDVLIFLAAMIPSMLFYKMIENKIPIKG